MDRSAIDLIQQTAIDASTHRLPDSLDDRVAALPVDYKLVDLENFQKQRTRFRGTFTTNHLPDFVSYVGKLPGGQGFIDPNQMAARVFFNLGDTDNPGHGDWNASLTLPETPAYSALLVIAGRPLSQQEVTDFIEDWLPRIGALAESEEGDSDLSVRRAVAAIRKIKIESTNVTETQRDNFRAAQSSLDAVEAKSDAGLPDLLTFFAEPFLGLQPRTFRLRLSILTGGREPKLVLRIIGKDELDQAIAEEFKAKLLDEIGDKATMFIGSFTP